MDLFPLEERLFQKKVYKFFLIDQLLEIEVYVP